LAVRYVEDGASVWVAATCGVAKTIIAEKQIGIQDMIAIESKQEKSRVFIASSGRTVLLAEKLRDELRTEFCEPRLWSQESKLQPGATIIEMLEGATEQSDFAVIVLAKDDVMAGGKGETLKARDNCVFEAGLFMAAIGRKRCFLVNSVSQEDLPTDLSGIISIPFKEPADLADRTSCGEAVAAVAATLKDIMQKEGPFAYHGRRLHLLSVEEVLRREQPVSDRGDLREDQVVVVDSQPTAEVGRAEQVRRNMDSGNSYHCFFYLSDNTIEKVCQILQMIVWAGMHGAAQAKDADFRARLDSIKDNKDLVLGQLRDLCRNDRLRVTLLLTEPTSLFRVHNASDPDRARLYAKRVDREKGSVQYALWAEGPNAITVWRALPKFLEEDKSDRLFIQLKYPPWDDASKRKLESSLSRWLSRYFPGMEVEVAQICLGGTL
jgi:predicted nucleotide-binding protein